MDGARAAVAVAWCLVLGMVTSPAPRYLSADQASPTRASQAARWEWARSDGCKGGIGVRLVVREGGATGGGLFLFAPDGELDFSKAAFQITLVDVRRGGRAVRFGFVPPGGQGVERMTVAFDGELAGGVGTAVRGWFVSEDVPPHAGTEAVFVRRE